MELRRFRPSPAMAVAVIALMAGTAGGAVAGGLITGAQVKDGSLTGKDVRNSSLRAKDLSAAARQSLRGQQGLPGAPGAALFDGPVPSGKTLTGTWGGDLDNSPNTSRFELETFAVRAPAPLVESKIGFGVNGADGLPSVAVAAAVANNDELPGICTGTWLAPTAPPGYLCLYVRNLVLIDVQGGSLSAYPLEVSPSPANVYGFGWQYYSGATGDARAEGTWAYTAP